MMENSLIFKLHGHLVKKGVTVDTTKFKEVHRSQYGLFRVYKILGVSESSKEWVKENLECDAGGWYCPGTFFSITNIPHNGHVSLRYQHYF